MFPEAIVAVQVLAIKVSPFAGILFDYLIANAGRFISVAEAEISLLSA